MGRPALAIGGIALIGAGAAIAFGWPTPSIATVDDQLTAQIHTVRIDVASGDVTIRTGDVSTTMIRQRFNYRHGNRPGNAYQVNGDQLVLSTCGDNCSVDFDVIVPSATAVTGKATSGNINLTDTGPVDVRATSGDVNVSLRTPENVRADA